MRADITRDDASLPRRIFHRGVVLFIDCLPSLAFLSFSLLALLSNLHCLCRVSDVIIKRHVGQFAEIAPDRSIRIGGALDPTSDELSGESSALQVLDFIARHFVLLDYGRIGRFEFSAREIFRPFGSRELKNFRVLYVACRTRARARPNFT